MISLNFWRSRLGAKIVALMITVSAVLSLGAAGVQLYLSYLRDRDRILNEFNVLEESFQSSLETALWQYNFKQVEVLLDGAFAPKDIVYLKLETPSGKDWERGDGLRPEYVLRDFPLAYERGGQDEVLGTLRAGLSLEFARQSLWQQFWALVASNFVKTFLASIAMLAIFDRLAGRHLRSIAQQIQMPWLNTQSVIEIDRPKAQAKDELDGIADSLNTTRKRVRTAHKELMAVNAKLSDANREQAEFTYAISHDLKSPSNTIGVLIDELSEVEKLSEEGRSVLNDMVRTNDHMRQLVDDVLEYSQLVGEDTTIEQVDLESLIDAIRSDLTAEIREAGAEITVEPLPSIMGNRMQLRMLFQNLLSNAIKFRAPNRSPQIVVAQQTTPNGVQITVADNGIGIPEEFRDRVFGLFKRLNNQKAFKGSGLGLTICQRVISNHNGLIQIVDGIDGGTAFSMTFPSDLT